MSTLLRAVRRTLVGDIENEYDEFDLDEDLEHAIRRSTWLEPSW